jgi:peptidoglycan/xylan/chitin deacetylase (PgdA/CDA1 family)
MSPTVDAEPLAGARAFRRDTERTARLMFDAELETDSVGIDAVLSPTVLEPLGVRPVPGTLARLLQSAAKKLGRLDLDVGASRQRAAIRRDVLGAGAAAPPRFLVRVDEFPHYLAWDEPDRYGGARFERFHEIMRAAGVPYLLAVLPRVSRAPLDPRPSGSRELDAEERTLLSRLRADGVALALHGRDHRTRYRSPRRHSELSGLSEQATSALLDEALDELARLEHLRPDVFVAPYNRFDSSQWPALAARFSIVGGGPESIRMLGLQPTPQWRGEAVYLPAYAPFYGRASEVRPAAERVIAQSTGLWTPIVLHWGWEAEAGWRELERLAEVIAPHAVSWPDFHAAVGRSR